MTAFSDGELREAAQILGRAATETGAGDAQKVAGMSDAQKGEKVCEE